MIVVVPSGLGKISSYKSFQASDLELCLTKNELHKFFTPNYSYIPSPSFLQTFRFFISHIQTCRVSWTDISLAFLICRTIWLFILIVHSSPSHGLIHVPTLPIFIILRALFLSYPKKVENFSHCILGFFRM